MLRIQIIRSFAVVVFGLCLSTAPYSGYSSTAETDKARTERLISLYKSVKEKPGTSACPLFKQLSAHFNLDLMTRIPLEAHASALNAKDFSRLQSHFLELVDLVTVRDTGDAFDQLEYTLSGPHGHNSSEPRLTGSEIRIEGTLIEEDIDVEIGFVWQKQKIVDVLIEGDSMILAYKNQFARIVSTKGITALQTKMKERLESERKQGIRCP